MAKTFEIAGGSSAAVSLINSSGTDLIQWKPKVTPWKDGGVVQSSKISEGERLRYRQFAVASELLRLNHVGTDQDEVIAVSRLLLKKLEEAIDYQLSKQNDSPVYLHVQGTNETNGYYALITKYQGDEFEEIFRGGFETGGTNDANTTWASVLKELKIVVNRGHWLGNAPGSSQCVQASSVQEWPYVAEWTVSTSTPTVPRPLLQTASGRIILGDEGQFMYSDDDADTWAVLDTSPFGDVLSLLETDTGRILAGEAGAFWYSDDDGDNWSFVNPGGISSVYSLMQTASGRILAGCSTKILYSDDDGETWDEALDTLGAVYDIIQTTSGRILAGEAWQIQYSDDDGDNWGISTTLPTGTVRSLMQSSSGRILAGSDGEIFISDDDGDTWALVSTDPVDAMYALYQTTSGRILAGDQGQIMYSDDDGLTWDTVLDPVGYVIGFLQTTSGKILATESGGTVWEYDISTIDMGATATCNDIVYAANKQNIANLTDIYVDDGGVWGDNLLPMTSWPVSLLPASPLVNDALYLGINTDIENTNRFCGVVYDIASIIQASDTYTVVYEYWNGAAWTTLTVRDGTNTGAGAFRAMGVCSVHWIPPSDWATRDISSDGGPSVTGYFIRARVSAISSGTLTAPTQQNRNIYAPVNNFVNIASAQVLGDIPMIAQIKAHNRSDEDGPGGSAPDLWINRLFIGLKETNATDLFQAFINISDEQNPVGITLSAGTNTSFAADSRAPSGRCAVYNPSGAESMATRATITFGPTIARDFYGQYRAFLRVQRTAGVYTDFNVRLQISTGSGGITETTDSKQVYSTQKFDVLDFGQITMPISGQLSPTELGDETIINIQANSDSGTPNLNIYDLAMIEVDKWSGDPTDVALEDDSEIGRSGSTDKLLNLDSVTRPKDPIRAIVQKVGSELKTSIYKPVTPSPVQLLQNSDQRLWSIAMRGILEGSHTGANNASTLTDSAVNFLLAGVKVGMTIYNTTDGSSATITAVTATTVSGTLSGGTDDDWDTNDEYYVLCPHWVADPEICHSIEIEGNPRYLYPRGAS